MSSSRPLFRRLVLGLTLVAGLGLASGCSFAPVYGEHGTETARLAVSYAAPQSRLEQIVYQELSLRLGTSDAPDAAKVAVSVTSSARVLAKSVTSDPEEPREATAYASVSVMRDGRIIANFNRSASADYTVSGQVLADRAALEDAKERAAKAVAESIRLALLGALTGP